MTDCRDCIHHIVISATERCKRAPMIDADGNPCFGALAFQRDEIGIWGFAHCGPEGKYWEGRG